MVGQDLERRLRENNAIRNNPSNFYDQHVVYPGEK